MRMPRSTTDRRSGLNRSALAGLALLLVYVGLSLLMDPKGYLGADTGAKVYTLEAMDRDGSARPVLSFWAESLDPDGELHPIFDSRRVDGGWVHVTTLPMLEAARPLYALGGYRLALLLPMLGSVGAAFAARAIARRLRASDDGWSAFWVVGLASPVAVYALDFWEHSIGLACMVGAVVLLLDVAEGKSPLRAIWAGGLLGSAATLRTEAFVYAAVTVLVVCVLQTVRSRMLGRSVLTGALAVLGFAGPWFANAALESAVGGLPRADRAAGKVSGLGGDAALADRLRDGLQTSAGLNAGSVGQAIALGAVAVLMVLAAFRAERRGDRRFATACLVGVGVLYGMDALGGLGFVPGFLIAFPLAIAAFTQVDRSSMARTIMVIALVALPLVYLFQPVGGGAPQWGGRYTLTSAILLGVVGLVGLLERFPTVGRGLIVLSVAVTMLGVAWLGVRSRSVDALFDDLREVDADVLIARDAFLLREGGPAVLDEHWLTAAGESQFTTAVEVAEASGADTVAVVELGAAAPPVAAIPPAWVERERIVTNLTGQPIGVVVYELP
jgi:hypothetical protein